MIKKNAQQNFGVLLLPMYSVNILLNLLFFLYYSVNFIFTAGYAKRGQEISDQQIAGWLTLSNNTEIKSSRLLLDLELRKKIRLFFDNNFINKIAFVQLKYKLRYYPMALSCLLYFSSEMLAKLVNLTNLSAFK